MVICVGEILADMIAREENGGTVYGRYAGGAPFNVACGIAKLGGKAGFYGCVGQDGIGDFLVRTAEARGFSYLRIDRLADRNTTLAFVDLDAGGERSFSFYRRHTADYALDRARIGEIAERAGIVHLGSLPLSEREGRAFYDELIEAAKARGKKIAFDVNYRSDIYADEAEAVKISRAYIRKADIVKVSAEEGELLTGEKDPAAAAQCLAEGDKTVFVTLGKAGSLCRRGKETLRTPAEKAAVVDTTGAGDAFFAGVLTVLDGEGAGSLEKALRIGSICGSLTTQKKGAIDAFPARAEVLRRFGNDRED